METVDSLTRDLQEYRALRSSATTQPALANLLDVAIYRTELTLKLEDQMLWSLSDVLEWLDTAVPAFGGRTPNQVIDEGEYALIEEMCYRLGLT